MDVSVYDSQGRIKNTIQPPEYLVGDIIAQSISTSNLVQSVTTGSDTAAVVSPITITGDGVNSTIIEFKSYGPYFSVGTIAVGVSMVSRLWDGAITSGTLVAQHQHAGVSATGVATGGGSIRYIVPPFTGTKTFNVSLLNGQAGTCTLVNQAGTNFPTYLTAYRGKSATQYFPPSVSLYNPLVTGGVAQIASNSESAVTNWQNTEYDTHGMFSSTLPDRVTIKQTGLYDVDLVEYLNATTVANQAMYSYITRTTAAGVTTKYFSDTAMSANSFTGVLSGLQTFHEQLRLDAGDILQFGFYQINASGTARTFVTGVVGCRVKVKWTGPSVGTINNDTQTIPIVSSLPTSPTDGQRIYFQTAAMVTDGIPPWEFRYNASSASAYKWEAVSATPWLKEADAGRVTTSASYGAVATDPITHTTPLAGDYIVDQGCYMYNNTAAQNTWYSFSVGAASALDADALVCQQPAGATISIFPARRQRRKNGVAASASIVENIRSTSGSQGTVQSRSLAIIPVRVG